MTALADSDGNVPSGYVKGEYLDNDDEAFERVSFAGEKDGMFIAELPRNAVTERGIKITAYLYSDPSYQGDIELTGFYEYQRISSVTESISDSEEVELSYQPAINPTRIELLIS